MTMLLFRLKRKIRLTIMIITIIFIEYGCSYVSTVSQTNIPSHRSHPVAANVYKFIFLGFNFTNDEVLKLTSELRKKCPRGDVRGILTKDIRTYYFLFFFWARETTASGFCVPNQNTALDNDPAELDSSEDPSELSGL